MGNGCSEDERPKEDQPVRADGTVVQQLNPRDDVADSLKVPVVDSLAAAKDASRMYLAPSEVPFFFVAVFFN